MNVIKRLFDLYIQGSIHVAVAVLSLVLMTNHMFHMPLDVPMAVFAFSGTVFGYNFIKYESLIRHRRPLRRQVKFIVVLSIAALLATGYSFLLLECITQITAVAFLALTVLYAIPFLPNNKNMRSLSGIKIYIVALCWAGITIVLPLQNAGVPLSSDVFLKFGQRFLLVIILILIFEIIDLKKDDPQLMTVPQKIGVNKTKMLNLFLLVPLYFLEFLKIHIDHRQLLVNLSLVTVTALFTVYASPERSKYYTSFWVESIPIFWLGMVVLAGSL
jgi:hypothetical protein